MTCVDQTTAAAAAPATSSAFPQPALPSSIMDPPDIHYEAVIAASQHAIADSGSTRNKRARVAEPTLADLYFMAKDIQNRSRHKVGAELSEDGRFRAFFGCGAAIALVCWNRLVYYELLPQEIDASILHFLWALFFMMVYPGDKAASTTAGGSEGAIDPKTLRKYVWPMIRAIARLESQVVSFVCTSMHIILLTGAHVTLDSTGEQVQERPLQ